MAKILRFGVLKTSGFLAIYSFFVGIIFTLIMGLLSLLAAKLLALIPGGIAKFSFSWLYLIILPFVYAILTFVLSLIVIPIMNLTLKITKGIDIDLEVTGKTY